MDLLNGKKTYIVGIGTILGAISGVMTGMLDIASAVQIIIPAVIGMTLKHGQQTGQ